VIEAVGVDGLRGVWQVQRLETVVHAGLRLRRDQGGATQLGGVTL
jgi:hypothetical protein